MGKYTASAERIYEIDFLKRSKISNAEFWVDATQPFWQYVILRQHRRCEWVWKDDGHIQDYYFYRGIFSRLKLDSQLASLEALWGHLVPGEMETEIINAALCESCVQHPEIWRQLHAAMQQWSPQRHSIFDPAFKQRVFALLCCNLRLQWPQHVLHQIIANLCAIDATTFVAADQ